MRLSDGSGYRIHVLTKATASVNSFGPESSRRFGNFVSLIIYNDWALPLDILVTTPNRLVHLLSQEPPGISLNRYTSCDVIHHMTSCIPSSVEWLILDECDKLFEDGETGFKDQVLTLPHHGYTLPHHGYTLPHHGYTLPHHGYTLPHHGYTLPR